MIVMKLREHIEILKNTFIGGSSQHYGIADYTYSGRKTSLDSTGYSRYVYECSLSICDRARVNPFKYICKYFNISADEDTLIFLEETMNNFEAAEQGKNLLNIERENILTNIREELPILIRKLSKKRLERELGLDSVDISTDYFPRFIFRYISPKGRSVVICEIIMNIENLNQFISYIAELNKYRQSVKGQRALMTSSLRAKILKRDNYTCKNCGISPREEPNILLEVDHIIPVSKGGITSEDNLQTLCWKCNRRKGNTLRVPYQ